MQGRRLALLIAAGEFADARLRVLHAPLHDVAALGAVLRDPGIGGYEVATSINEPAHVVRKAINRFFRQVEPDDFLLLYVSSHGLKDERGHLYFAAADTSLDELQSTTFESDLIHRLSGDCRARQQLFLFDACFSGAFGRAWLAKDGGQGVHKDDIVGSLADAYSHDISRGLVVFSASTSFQYSFESVQAPSQPQPSVFTRHVVEGLRSGAADLNGDGLVTEDELYRYAYSHTHAEQPAQTPQRWVIGAVGEIAVARSLHTLRAALPAELVDALRSPIAVVRAAAVEPLADLAAARGKRMPAAIERLQQLLADDDSNQVREAARAALRKVEPVSDATAAETQAPATPPAAAAAPRVLGKWSPESRTGTLVLAGSVALIGVVLSVWFGISPPRPVAGAGRGAERDAAPAPTPVAATQPPRVRPATSADEAATGPPRGSLLDAQAKEKLAALVRRMASIAPEVVIVVGHTDNMGTEAESQRLSMRRAEAVKFYLVAQGVERNRIYVDGKGASQPVGDNTTSGGRARNNRVEIEVVGTRRGVEGAVDKVSFKAEVNFR